MGGNWMKKLTSTGRNFCIRRYIFTFYLVIWCHSHLNESTTVIAVFVFLMLPLETSLREKPNETNRDCIHQKGSYSEQRWLLEREIFRCGIINLLSNKSKKLKLVSFLRQVVSELISVQKCEIRPVDGPSWIYERLLSGLLLWLYNLNCACLIAWYKLNLQYFLFKLLLRS